MSQPTGYYVLDAKLFARPMVLCPNDGNRAVPEGGILLLTPLADSGTEFEDRDAAEAAIERTLAHSQAHGYDWAREHYRVCRARDYVREAKTIREERRDARAKERAPESGELTP